MKKLELKYVAPYFEHNVKVMFLNKIYEIHALHRSGIALFEDYDEPPVFTTYDSVKLILHNLSDLTKEIEHNGEKFIPADELTAHEQTILENNDFFEEIPVWGIPYQTVQKFIELHFDCFELIDAGLAISIK